MHGFCIEISLLKIFIHWDSTIVNTYQMSVVVVSVGLLGLHDAVFPHNKHTLLWWQVQ